MEIKLMSDCHLEFGGMEPGEGDVLILAGDVVIVNDIALETPQGKYYKRWLKRASKSYKKVFMVLGNHEHYHGDILEVVKQLKESVPENVTILQNESELYEGVQFVGTTLWTNYNNEDPNVMEQASLQMNDFACVRKGEFGTFSVSDALSEHKKAVKYLDETLPKLKEPTVVITHHAPHPNSLGEYVLGELKYAYHSDLTELIEKHQPLYWCHGHIHNNKDYKIGDTTILCNPRGYKNYAENDDFDPTFTVTVKEVAQPAPTST